MQTKTTASVRVLCSSLMIFSVVAASPAVADDNAPSSLAPMPDAWVVNVTPQVFTGSYSNTALRDTVSGYGLATDFQYLERGGISLGTSSTTLKFKSASVADTNQTSYNLGGRLNFTPDMLNGVLTLAADYDQISNNDSTNETNGVSVVAPQISFLNYARTYYLDLGYAKSTYGDSNAGNGSLSVTQVTPTFGFGFNDGAEWIQLRSYSIQSSNVTRSNNVSSTSAVDVKWTHYFATNGLLPEQMMVEALSGKRMYAVDGSNVNNLADTQTSGAALAMQWGLGKDCHLYLQTGQNGFDASSLGTAFSYTASYWFVALNGQW